MPNDHTDLKKKIISVMDSISRTAQKCGREPGAIRLVAACKKVPEQKIRTAVEAGVTLLGESYL